MLWEELVKTALLGTERSTLSKQTLQTLAANGIDIDEEPAKVILQAAAFYGQQRKVGFVLPTYSGELPAPIKNTNVQICSYKSSRHLALILKGDYELALPEFIHHLTINKKQLPPESLPKLLNDYKKQAEFRDKLLPVLGERGSWLIQQNPGWAIFLPQTNIAIWETGKKSERLSLLQYLRQTQADKALNLLQSTWQEEIVKDKVDFLKTFYIGISKSDEAFLEKCTNDKRKSVRTEAVKLLAKIPDSALVERMYQRVITCFSFKKGLLSIQLPDELDEEAVKDGINPTLQMYSGGLKASRLGQMIAKIPPQRWETYFNENASTCLQIFVHSPWSAVILQALIEASISFPTSSWIKTLVQYWVKEDDLDIWEHSVLKKFIAIIPNEVFNEVIRPYLKYHTGLLDEQSAVSQLLRAGEHQWSDEVTILLVKNFQNWLNNTNDYYWNNMQYKQLFLTGAYRCRPDLYNKLSLDWNFSKRIAQNFQHEVERFLRTLLFRKNMMAELQK